MRFPAVPVVGTFHSGWEFSINGSSTINHFMSGPCLSSVDIFLDSRQSIAVNSFRMKSNHLKLKVTQSLSSLDHTLSF